MEIIRTLFFGTLPTEVLVILGAGLALFVILFLARFGKMLAKVTLVICGLLLAVVVVALLSSQTTATTATTSASVGQAATSAGGLLCAGGLGAVALLAGGAAVLFYIRWRLSEQRRPGLDALRAGRLSYRPHRQTRQRPPAPKIVYLAADHEDDDLADFAGWGW